MLVPESIVHQHVAVKIPFECLHCGGFVLHADHFVDPLLFLYRQRLAQILEGLGQLPRWQRHRLQSNRLGFGLLEVIHWRNIWRRRAGKYISQAS